VFVNKLDRVGANPFRVIQQARDKLKLNAAAVQVPIGLEEFHEGVVDLIGRKAFRNRGKAGLEVRGGWWGSEALGRGSGSWLWVGSGSGLAWPLLLWIDLAPRGGFEGVDKVPPHLNPNHNHNPNPNPPIDRGGSSPG